MTSASWLGVMRIRDIADLHDQRGFLDFFERGAESGNQIGRKIAQKTYCVGKQDAAARRKAHRANGGIERGEHFRGSQHVGMGQRVEERGFAGVGVADQRDHAERNGLARAAARGALAANGFDGLLDFADAVADAAAVGFEFLFARAAGADAAAQAGKLFAASGEARQQIIQLREFDLQLAFAGARVLAKISRMSCVRSITRRAGALLHVAELHGREVVVHDHKRHVARFGFGANFVQLAAPHERGGIERVAHLHQRCRQFSRRRSRRVLRVPAANRGLRPEGSPA